MTVTSPLRVVLPEYQTPRNAWREKIHAAVMDRMRAEKINYSAEDQLTLEVCLYMSDSMLRFHGK